MKPIFILTSVLFFNTAIAQVTIKGTVVDVKQNAIPGANVLIADSYDGTSTDSEGRFEFVTSEQGKKTLIIRFVGYKESAIPLEITGNVIDIQAVLTEEISELQQVTITAGAFTASDASRRTVFRALDIATTAGATADIAGALNTLPGTQKVGESGRLFVRGGDDDEAKTFIDGLVVQDPYGPSAPNTPSRGRFLPFMFKGMGFSTGGYSAEYGQALSSALVLDSKDKAELQRTDFGILSVGGDVGHTQVWNRGSAGGKVQYTNLKPYTRVIRQETDWIDAPVSFESNAALRQEVGKTGMFKLYGNFNRSKFSLYQHDIDNPNLKSLHDLENKYHYLNSSFKDILSENWSVRGGISYNNLTNEIKTDTIAINQSSTAIHIKAVAEGSISDRVELKAGAESVITNFRETDRGHAIKRNSLDETITSLFFESDVSASSNLIIRVGARGEHNNLQHRFSLDPRISLAYKLGTHSQVSVAYGKFRQSVKTEFLKLNTGLQPEKATHYIINYQFVRDNKTFRVESFYKQYSDLVKFGNSSDQTLGNSGKGKAKGFEVFWRDNTSINRLDYWISYSFLDTKRAYLDYPYEATPSFASKHNLSVVTKYFLREVKSQLGFTYSFTSGRPYNNPNLGRFNGVYTPNYSDLSFNWSYLPTTSTIIYLSCTNLLGRDNVFGYEYSTVPNNEGAYNSRPIRQAAPRFLFVGIFITLSKDKSVNQLPNL